MLSCFLLCCSKMLAGLPHGMEDGHVGYAIGVSCMMQSKGMCCIAKRIISLDYEIWYQ